MAETCDDDSNRCVYTEELRKMKSKRHMIMRSQQKLLAREFPEAPENPIHGLGLEDDDVRLKSYESLEWEQCGPSDSLRFSNISDRRQGVTKEGIRASALGYINELDDNLSLEEHEGQSHGVPLYKAPEQRQKWGEVQVLPHIDWGDIFFDLFYVAAAYNLGTMLMGALTPTLWPRGVLYFLGIGGPLFHMWEMKLTYEARYHVADYSHRVLETLRVFFLSFAVLHITPLNLMSDPKSAETFLFTLGLVLELLVHMLAKVELIFVGKGDVEAIKNHSKGNLKYMFTPMLCFYVAATVISGVLYFGEVVGVSMGVENEVKDGYGKYSDGTKNEYNKQESAEQDYGAENASNGADYGHLRWLAPAGDAGDSISPTQHEDWNISDLPIALCALSFVLTTIITLYRKMFLIPREKDFRKNNVPDNIDFCIHRYGEWIMLMLGEGVLSLLIVETTESSEYYMIACFGILTVIMLQCLHFTSEPHHMDGHALWRSVSMAYGYNVLIQLLSFGLIAFGVSYKAMLSGIHNKALSDGDGYGNKRRFLFGCLSLPSALSEEQYERHLAPAVAVSDQAIAALFGSSLCLVLLLLEVIKNTHTEKSTFIALLLDRHKFSKDEVQAVKFPSFLIAVVKFAILAFTASLPTWVTDPVTITTVGFFIVLAFALTRAAGSLIFKMGLRKAAPGHHQTKA